MLTFTPMNETFHPSSSRGDTICAIATPLGGAIAVVRVSGSQAIPITDRLFSKSILQSPNRSLHYGTILYPTGQAVDEVMVSVYRAPHSYTGEDATEISCHGSPYIAGEILRLLLDAGCRQATGGEFTLRAFLNGKMDLSQAEAVADLISSSNGATHRLALSQLRGNVSGRLADLRQQLLHITSLLELELDFSDHEELEFADRSQLLHLSLTLQEQLGELSASFRSGRAIKEGIPVAIVGKTNVGKSTLLNQLAGEERAIVSDIHGTTRDVIEDSITIHGVSFRFIDTAGLRATDDTIERIGIDRTYKKLNESSVVLWVVDAQPSSAEIAEMEKRCTDKQLILVFNKSDLPGSPSTLTAPLSSSHRCGIPVISISAKIGTGLDELRQLIYDGAHLPDLHSMETVITSARHYDALCHAQSNLQRVIDGLHLGLSGDLLSEDLRLCLNDLGEITGQGVITSSEVLNNIFSHFCIGK